jgi:hypothetical protein
MFSGCNELCARLLQVGLLVGLLASPVLGQQMVSPTQTACNHFKQLQMTTATTTQLVALVSGQQVRICAYALQGSTTSTGTTLTLVYGTGTSCATGTTSLTPAWNMPASSTALPFSEGKGVGELFQAPAGNALCATSSAAGTVNISVTYAQF